jgi:hypothetical protein
MSAATSRCRTKSYNPEILRREATKYAKEFLSQDDAMEYPMGCPNGAVNKAFFYVIQAAHLLCSDYEGNWLAPELLKMAIEEIEAAKEE